MARIAENEFSAGITEVHIEITGARNDVVDRLTSVGIDIKYTWAVITVGNRDLAGTGRIDVLDSLLDTASDFNVTVGDKIRRSTERIALRQDKGRVSCNGSRSCVIVFVGSR